MPNIRTNGWVRIEGCTITDLYKQYGTLTGIPNAEQHIYYGAPEIQIDNPYSDTHSTVYTVKSIKNFFGYAQIHDIDENWGTFVTNIQTWMNQNEVDISDPNTKYYYVGKPEAITESCVIFYDDSSKSSTAGAKYSHYAIILIDEYAIPPVISITAEYTGGPVPVQEEIEMDKLKVTAIYDDGNSIKINSGFVLDPPDNIVQKLGSNLFTVYYTDPEGDVNSTTFIVQGCRNLQSISGKWDGGQVAINRTAEKKFFVIIAHYSDDTESTVTDFSFPNGQVVTELNQGIIDIFYQGRTCQVEVPMYTVQQSRLIATYNGPAVEVDHMFQLSHLRVKIYYSTADDTIQKGYYEDIDIEDCKVPDRKVTKEGSNSFSISYTGELGEITTTFTVPGFIPDLKPTAIQATYNGPGVYQGKTFDLERVLCNIYYNDGTIKTVKNFIVSTNIIHNVGINDIIVTYIEDAVTLETTISINGLENDSTTNNNIFPTSLNNNYPRATILNNRYRGPAEGIKTNNYAKMIIQNIQNLYYLFADIEKQYNKIIETVAGDNSIKILTLNNVTYMNNQLDNILQDDHYTTGQYKSEDVIK